MLCKTLVSSLSPCLDLLHSDSPILPSTRHSPVRSTRMLSWSRRPPPSGSPGFRLAHPCPHEPRPTPAGLPPPTRTAQEPAEHPHVQIQPEPPARYQVQTQFYFQTRGTLLGSLFLSHPQLHLTQHCLQSCDVTGQIMIWFLLQGEPRHLDQK